MFYRVPGAMGWDEWDQWERDTARKHPVQFFFRSKLPRWWRRNWRRFVHDPWYELKCRIWHRYNVVVCHDLPPTWCDRDYILLHASFQILKDFVEKEKPFEHFDTEDSHNKDAWLEIKALYDWWDQRRKEDDDDSYDTDSEMLCRLIAVRKHLWT